MHIMITVRRTQMKNKLKLSKYIACICEGGAETAIMDILLSHDLLIFSKEDLLEEEILRCRKAADFEKQYLKKQFDSKISVIRVLDRDNENFNVSKPYKEKIEIVNIVTSPEIEMLIICNENMYEEYCKVKSNLTPSNFCKQYISNLKYNKKMDDIYDYFDTPEKLVRAIKLYHEKHKTRSKYT